MSEEMKNAVEGSPYRRHIPALDGVRGVAVLGVLVQHFFTMPVTSGRGKAVQWLVNFSGVGVPLFFVLSGFLITGILFDSLGDRAYFRKFYARRVLRIAPLYYGVLLVFAVTAVVLGKNYHRELLSMSLYLQNTNVVAPAIWYYTAPPMLPLLHFWTLAVEEQFYLVWPLVVFAMKGWRDVAWACVGGIVLSMGLRWWLVVHGVGTTEVEGMTLCRMDTLLGGGLLAMLVRSRWHDAVLATGEWIAWGGLAVTLAARWLPVKGMGFTASYAGYALMCVGVVALSLRGKSANVFGVAWLRWLGRYSYGIYVLHYIAREWMMQRSRVWLMQHGVGAPAVAVVLAGVGIAGLSVGAAVVSYELYEKRFLGWKKKFAYAA